MNLQSEAISIIDLLPLVNTELFNDTSNTNSKSIRRLRIFPNNKMNIFKILIIQDEFISKKKYTS